MSKDGHRLDELIRKVATPKVILQRQRACIVVEEGKQEKVKILVNRGEATRAGIPSNRFVDVSKTPRGFAFIEVPIDVRGISPKFMIRHGKQVTTDVVDGEDGLRAVNLRNGVLRKGGGK